MTNERVLCAAFVGGVDPREEIKALRGELASCQHYMPNLQARLDDYAEENKALRAEVERLKSLAHDRNEAWYEAVGVTHDDRVQNIGAYYAYRDAIDGN